MKNKIKIIGMLVIMFFISGSYKNTGVIEINENKSVDIELIYAVDQQKLSAMVDDIKSKNNDDENMSDIEILDFFNEENIRNVYEKAGFTVTEYTEIINNSYNWEGLKIKKHYDNIETISGADLNYFLLNKKSDMFEDIDDSKIFSTNGKKFSSNILVYLDFDREPGKIDYKKYEDSLDLTYIVRVPKKVISTNAHEVSEDGKELVWNLEMGNKNELAFEFDLPELSFLMKYKNHIIIGSSVLLIIVILTIVFINRPKMKQNVVKENNESKLKPLDAQSLSIMQNSSSNVQSGVNQINNNQNM